MHRARRSQCKDWWNPQWRDRLLRAMSWLADGDSTLAIPVSSTESVVISTEPMTFKSPVSYNDPETTTPPGIDPEEVSEDDERDPADDEY